MVQGVVHLDEAAALFEAMLRGWSAQQQSRMLSSGTVNGRVRMVRRFVEFTGSYPWQWGPSDVEDYTMFLTSRPGRLAPSTVRGHHLTLRLFCDYLTDTSYGWGRQCQDRFGVVPMQVCHEWNTVAHLNDYEGLPARRPLTYDEVQTLFDFLDERVELIAGSGRKGAMAALRDAQMIKTAYAFGLRRNELCRLEVVDLRPNPHVPTWGTYGAVHVRYGKAIRGGVPRRRLVLTVPEFDWVIPGLAQWVDLARPILNPGNHPGLWLTERGARVSVKNMDKRFAMLREQAGLDPALTLHCLRHSYVTHLIEFGYPERFVQEQVGHAFASTTAIYAGVSDDFKAKTLQAALARVHDPVGRGPTQQENR